MTPSLSPSRPTFRPPDEPRVFTATAYGMVGTGPSPAAAKADLMEKVRQAGER